MKKLQYIFNLISSFITLWLRAKGMKNKLKFFIYCLQDLIVKILPFTPYDKDLFIEFNDCKVWFGAFAGELSSYIEIFVRKDYELVKEFAAGEYDTIFDIGANIGLYTIRQTLRSPKAKVYAFEPNPLVFARLNKNIRENNIKNACIFNTAVYSQQCSIGFNYNNKATGTGYLDSSSSNLKVKTITLNNFIDKLNIQKIDLIKIDVEGSEVEVLRGADKALTVTSKIVMECHSRELKEQAESLLTAAGFQKIMEIKGKPIFTLYFKKAV